MKMMLNKRILIISFMIFCTFFLFARSTVTSGSDKKFDLVKYHNVGNIWLRVSNYGFFGSGDDITPQWPSLEYPGGSAIDYLYQGALWFGAKKIRRNDLGQKLYWVEDPDDENDVIPATDPEWNSSLQLVVDTLTTCGFDGDADLYEFLPAYNPLETAPLGQQYNMYNISDTILYSSIRKHRRGVDDDGDGQIDEDPIGYGFPFRISEELPEEFESFGGAFLQDFDTDEFTPIEEAYDIWFPLGFVDLSDESNEDYNFAAPTDDDGDTLTDEDGYPVSEQDFISYYYDYSPFPDGYTGDRDWGSSKGSNKHFPLNVRIRQMSYQWSYEYIKNLVYVEFDITNMNPEDTLYDCAMGIYMDSDVGPQAWGAQQRANDDKSGYVAGEGFEFAYTFDADGDNGLTTGLVGSRVCTPDPDSLEFACWYWNVGQGPDDSDPLDINPSGPTANEKYYLLTGRNPQESSYTDLKLEDQESPGDTRYLFAFYGDMNGMTTPETTSWNLAPYKTMKIVIGVFPGENLQDLKKTSSFSKLIYGKAQNLESVVLPDIEPHYQAPEPPAIPNMYAELVDNGNQIDIYWDNVSEMNNVDTKTVDNQKIGWQTINPELDSYVDDMNNPDPSYLEGMPEEFWPQNYNGSTENLNALVNPFTGYRLRHDFQGYTLWGRSGSGSQEFWMHEERWDKIETDQDIEDYAVNFGLAEYLDFGGSGIEWQVDKGLPNAHDVADGSEYLNYYRYDENYLLTSYEVGDTFYGKPIYNWEVTWSQSLVDQAAQLASNEEKALLFKHPDMDEDIYLAFYDGALIPLPGFGGQSVYYDDNGQQQSEPVPEKLEALRQNRLSRRYYYSNIKNPPKGIEYYTAVTSWDRGMPSIPLGSLESGRDADANMKVIFPGPLAKSAMDEIFVTPNPYVGQSKFDGRRDNDEKGDKSRRLWFANLPEKCTIRIYTLAGDLVDTIKHDGNSNYEDVISVSKASYSGLAASGIEPWDLLTRNNQIIASGVYLYSVEDEDGDVKVDKFVIIK